MAVYLGKYRWNEEDAKEFSEFFTASRTYLNVLIGTSVKPDQMIKAIREDYTKKIEIKWLVSSFKRLFLKII